MTDWYSNYKSELEDKKYKNKITVHDREKKLTEFFDIIVECIVKSDTKIKILNITSVINYELPCKQFHPKWSDFKYTYNGYSQCNSYLSFHREVIIAEYAFDIEDLCAFFYKYMKERYELPFYYSIFKLNIGKLKKKETY